MSFPVSNGVRVVWLVYSDWLRWRTPFQCLSLVFCSPRKPAALLVFLTRHRRSRAAGVCPHTLCVNVCQIYHLITLVWLPWRPQMWTLPHCQPMKVSRNWICRLVCRPVDGSHTHTWWLSDTVHTHQRVVSPTSLVHDCTQLVIGWWECESLEFKEL